MKLPTLSFISVKDFFIITISVIGAFVAEIMGGWDTSIQTLLIFMIIDYATGLIVAGIFKNSPKTLQGALQSCEARKGLFRKGTTFLIILISYRLDILLDTNIIRNGTIIAFSLNELLSITENVGLMGLPLPKVIKDAIEILKEKESD